jgi:uncharacterized membrane protein YgcG
MLRIELGGGMQKYISDDDVEEIIDAHIIPAFMRGDYTGGVQAGVMELMQIRPKENGEGEIPSAAEVFFALARDGDE